MAIHGFVDTDMHVVCLVGWIGRANFLFGWMDICRIGQAIFLFGWMNEDREDSCSHHLPKLVMLPL
jgi:hypothetical protein